MMILLYNHGVLVLANIQLSPTNVDNTSGIWCAHLARVHHSSLKRNPRKAPKVQRSVRVGRKVRTTSGSGKGDLSASSRIVPTPGLVAIHQPWAPGIPEQ
ncbi:hypothetical protein J6590_071435 [Homalodisca vitripennis]|nr:hypothetical protein J6590_071435 [Homalodisca vitripennis]